MARFDIYRLRTGEMLVVDLQADLLDALDTRVVAPLLRAEAFSKPINRLNPVIELDGGSYVLAVHLMGTISVKEIAETLGSLGARYDDVTAATDFLFSGF